MSWIELVAQRRPREVPEGVTPPKKEDPGYRIENMAASGDETDVYVYDAIGGWLGVCADDLIRDLKAVNSTRINLRLNSPGGSVFEGIAIANALRAHPAAVTVYVDGLAASIASVIALAGERLVMMPQSQMMIHDASGGCYGNAADMQYMVDLLDKQSDNIADAYADRAGGTAAEWRDLMKAETWYSAKEAVAAGLADEVASMPGRVDEATEARAPLSSLMNRTWDLTAFKYAGREQAPAPQVEDASTATQSEAAALAAVAAMQTEIAGLTALITSMRNEFQQLKDAGPPPWLQPDEEEDEPEDAAAPEEEMDDEAEDAVEDASEEAPDAAAESEAAPTDELSPNAESPLGESPATPDLEAAWTQIVAQFDQPSPSADDVFNSLREAW